MSDLYDAVDDEIRACTPVAAPPFALLAERKRRGDRRRMALGAAALVLLMLAGGAAWGRGAFDRDSAGRLAGEGPNATPDPGLVSTDTPVAGDTYVLLDNRTLQIQVAIGGGCEETGKAAGVVGEGVDKVQIRVTVARHPRTAPPGAVCPTNLILQNIEIHLSRNLGGREVVDETGHKTLRAAPGDGARVKAPAATQLQRTDEFGIVTAISGGGADMQISVDRVDMLTGSEAAAAARAAGADDQLDYYLRNDNPLTRMYRVDPNAVVWGSIQLMPEPWPQRTTLAHWQQFVATHLGQRPPFHFMVDNGVVTGIEEQYLP
jgi:hypothetical protein